WTPNFGGFACPNTARRSSRVLWSFTAAASVACGR
ncbi:glyoxalase, partial [Rhizobium sp. J15]